MLYATRPLSRCCWRPVHDSGESFGMFIFWQCSCHIVSCSLNSCYIRLVFRIFRSCFYISCWLLGSSCGILTKFAFINSDISSVTSSKWVGSIRREMEARPFVTNQGKYHHKWSQGFNLSCLNKRKV